MKTIIYPDLAKEIDRIHFVWRFKSDMGRLLTKLGIMDE